MLCSFSKSTPKFLVYHNQSIFKTISEGNSHPKGNETKKKNKFKCLCSYSYKKKQQQQNTLKSLVVFINASNWTNERMNDKKKTNYIEKLHNYH